MWITIDRGKTSSVTGNMNHMNYRWTVTALVLPPTPVGVLLAHGAASLVDDVTVDLLDVSGIWLARITEPDRAGVEVHEVACAPESTAALRDRWTVALRSLVADTPDLCDWRVDVSVGEEAEDTDAADDDSDQPMRSAVDIDPELLADALLSQIDYEQSLFTAAELFRALPLELLSVAGLEQADPDARGEALRDATRLAGCMVVAAEHVTDGLFADITTLRTAHERGEAVDIDDLDVISLLPRRFAARYDALFAQKFLVALTDMTTRITAGWTELSCVAQELAVRVWLDHVDFGADAAGVALEDGWRGEVEEYLFEDVDHEYLYNPAMDGFETDEDFAGPPGMAPMRFEDWFVPFNDDRHLPVYALDRPSTR
jgi:hypothetical protein